MIFFALGDQRKASSRVRVFWISEQIQTNVKVIPGIDGLWLFWYGLIYIKDEIFVLQKNTSRYSVFFAKCLKKLGKKVFFDIDDYPDPNNSKITMRNFEEMCSCVDGIFVGSPNLLKLCVQFNTKTFLLPTGIKMENYKINKYQQSEEVCLGWIGNGKTYASDLICVLEEPLTILAKKFKIKLKIVGSLNHEVLISTFRKIPNLIFEHIPEINWEKPDEVDCAMGDFDVGLYPLLENNVNKYKCGFKALEYYSKGIPVISSDVSMNKELVIHGITGYLAKTSEEWVEFLSVFILNQNIRRNMGFNGYKNVRDYYEIKIISNKFISILKDLI